jgi:hypothetical protein
MLQTLTRCLGSGKRASAPSTAEPIAARRWSVPDFIDTGLGRQFG